MTKEQVRQILDRVRHWPAERQADLAEVAMLMESQDKSAIGLSTEQADEVRRRLAEPSPKTTTLAEFNERLRRRYGV
jgi:membrane protein YdbS with pleckstrin-like domain